MARARIVHAFFLNSREAWAVEIDDLQGTVKSGQHATFTVDGVVAGPQLIRRVEYLDHRTDRNSYLALVVQAARKRGLDRFSGGTVEVTDLP